MCQQGYSNGDAHICQSMTSQPVDAGVVQAFLEAVSPASVPIAMRVLDQIEHDLAGQRRQRELQLEQARSCLWDGSFYQSAAHSVKEPACRPPEFSQGVQAHRSHDDQEDRVRGHCVNSPLKDVR